MFIDIMRHLNGTAVIVNSGGELHPLNLAALGVLTNAMAEHGSLDAERRLTALLTGLSNSDQHQHRVRLEEVRARWKAANSDNAFPPLPVHLGLDGEALPQVTQPKAEDIKPEPLALAPEPAASLPAMTKVTSPATAKVSEAQPPVQRKLQFAAVPPTSPPAKETTRSAPAISKLSSPPNRRWVEVAAAVPANDPHVALGRQMGAIVAGAVAAQLKAVTQATSADQRQLDSFMLSETAGRMKLAKDLASLDDRYQALRKELKDKAFQALSPAQPPAAPAACCECAALETRITDLEHALSQPTPPAPAAVVLEPLLQRLQALENATAPSTTLTSDGYEQRLHALEDSHGQLQVSSEATGSHESRLAALETARMSRAEARLAEQKQVTNLQLEQSRQEKQLETALAELAALKTAPTLSWTHAPATSACSLSGAVRPYRSSLTFYCRTAT